MFPYYQDLFCPSRRKRAALKVPIFTLSDRNNQTCRCAKSSPGICQTQTGGRHLWLPQLEYSRSRSLSAAWSAGPCSGPAEGSPGETCWQPKGAARRALSPNPREPRPPPGWGPIPSPLLEASGVGPGSHTPSRETCWGVGSWALSPKSCHVESFQTRSCSLFLRALLLCLVLRILPGCRRFLNE